MLHASRLSHAKLIDAVVAGEHSLLLDGAIRRSWTRCLHEHHLDPARPRALGVLGATELQERQERHAALLSLAKIEMANLHQQIAGSGYALVLTDADGVVLHHAGDEAFLRTAGRLGMLPGAVWSEEHQGTNGMGTCIVERRPIVVHREEHFYVNNIDLTCSAAPIFDPQGNLLAVLDASGQSNLAQQHTVVLVNMSAQTIENRAFLHAFRNQFVMRFHSRPEFINSPGEGIIAFDAEGRILAGNRSALLQLGQDAYPNLCGRRIDEVFHITLPELFERAAPTGLNAAPMRESAEGRRFFALIREPEHAQRQRRAPAARERPDGACGLLDQLDLGDRVMAENVRRARRILDRQVPLLLLGETGTGKGLFAKALHLASARADKPFVAVNCASIPESLIESELFGYRPGAFTGASREGRRGKILQANGGTLFLDEIGDMPLSLQARLLRVLEEKEVVPIGGEGAVTVDIMVISATHADLKELVAGGRFREDLYYRLEGLTFLLPPLRERADRRTLIKHLLEVESGPERIEIDEQALDILDRYDWPGNIRQLRTTLRAMIALRAGDRLRAADVPGELARQVGGHGALAQPANGNAGLTPLALAERGALLKLLEEQYWNISKTAKRSGLSRNTLYRRMKRLGIEPPR